MAWLLLTLSMPASILWWDQKGGGVWNVVARTCCQLAQYEFVVTIKHSYRITGVFSYKTLWPVFRLWSFSKTCIIFSHYYETFSFQEFKVNIVAQTEAIFDHFIAIYHLLALIYYIKNYIGIIFILSASQFWSSVGSRFNGQEIDITKSAQHSIFSHLFMKTMKVEVKIEVKIEVTLNSFNLSFTKKTSFDRVCCDYFRVDNKRI